MDSLDFHKEQYDKELERAHGISDSFGVPVSIATVIVGAIDYAFLSIHATHCENTEIVLIGSIALSSLLMVISVYHLIKCIANFTRGYDYYTLPDPEELVVYEKKLKLFQDHAKTAGEAHQMPAPPNLKIENVSKKPGSLNGIAHSSTATEFNEYLTEVLVRCTAHNQKNNAIKLYHRFLCIRFLTFAIIACLPMVPFIIIHE